MEKKVKSSILKTLIYSDIFDYPLEEKEIWRFLIARNVENIDRATFKKALIEFPPGRWERKNGYYFLFGREEIVEKRIERKKESREKLDFAKKIIQKLSIVPTVLFIGISGGLALENSEKEDDIDLFVITGKNSLWLTRLIMIIFLKFIGRYRSYNSVGVSDKICLNMLIDEDEESLVFPKKRQNLYTAHEIVQLMPILNKNYMHEKFLDSNTWVKKFLPNAFINRKTSQNMTQNDAESFLSVFLRFILRFSALEYFAKKIQLLSINKRKTTEIVSDNLLAFHPFDYKNKILNSYKTRLEEYGII